jgi:hypothetical protein
VGGLADRALEPIGSSITIRYTVKIPVAQRGLEGIEAQLQGQMGQLTSAAPISSSSDTYVVHVSQPGQPDRRDAFNSKSPLMPTNESQRNYLSRPPFSVSLYLKPLPVVPQGACGNLPPEPDIDFIWDEKLTSERVPDNFDDGAPWKGVIVIYRTTDNYLKQAADAVFQIRINRSRALSVFDLSQSYLRLFSRTQEKIEFTDLTVFIGQHPFPLSKEQLVSNECGVIILHLPTLTPL